MPSYNPDVSLDTILGGVSSGFSSMLQGIVNGALQRQELALAKERLKAYEKQVKVQEEAQKTAATRLMLEQGIAATNLLQNIANQSRQPVEVPASVPKAMNIPSFQVVKKPVIERKVVQGQQQEVVPITKGQLPTNTPQSKPFVSKYEQLISRVPKDVMEYLTKLGQGRTFNNMKKIKENDKDKEYRLPVDLKPIDMTPEQLDKWLKYGNIPSGPKTRNVRKFLKNLQKAKEEDLKKQQQLQPPQFGTINKAFTEPTQEVQTTLTTKEVKEPYKIYPVTPTGEPALYLDENFKQQLQKSYPFVSEEAMVDIAKHFTNNQVPQYVDTVDKLNQKLQNMLSKTGSDGKPLVKMSDILSTERFLWQQAVSTSVGSGVTRLTGEDKKEVLNYYHKLVLNEIKVLEKAGVSKNLINHLKGTDMLEQSYSFVKVANEVMEEAVSLYPNDSLAQQKYIISTMGRKGYPYTTYSQFQDEYESALLGAKAARGELGITGQIKVKKKK